MADFDFLLTNHGSIFVLRALTPEATEWVGTNLPEGFNGAIESRYVDAIVSGFSEEGLTWH